MPFDKLTADQVTAYGSQYVSFLRSLKPGEGARAKCSEEGVTKITLKKRLEKAAGMANVQIKFHRSPEDQVILERRA